MLDQRKAQSRRVTGLRLLLDWLTTQPGTSWQERWLASGADAAGPAWREVPAGWLHQQGYDTKWRQEALVEALPVAVSADLIRPSLQWLVTGGPARGMLAVVSSVLGAAGMIFTSASLSREFCDRPR